MSEELEPVARPAVAMSSGVQRAAVGSALVVSVLLLAGRLGGLLRDLIVAPLFGTGPGVDALVAARTVPELFLVLATAGAISSGLLPALSRFSRGSQVLPAEGVRAISVLVNWLILLTILFTAAGLAFPESLINAVTPGLDPERERTAITLLRVMLPATVFVTLAAILGAYYNFKGHFALPSARAAVTNVVIVVLTVMLAESMGVASVAFGWSLGALLQLVLLLAVVRRVGVQYSFSFDLRAPQVGPLIRTIAPVLAAQFLLYGRVLLERQFASWLPAGDLARLNYAYRIGTAPMLIIANAITTVYLPLFSTHAAGGDRERLSASVGQGVRLLLVGIVPFAVVFAVMPTETVRTLLEHGGFAGADTAATARLLAWYTVTLIGASAAALLAAVFYALGSGTAAMVAMAGGLAVQAAVTASLIGSFGAVGVAIGTGAGLMTSTLLLGRRLRKQLGGAAIGLGAGYSLKIAAAAAALAGTVAATRWGLVAADFGLPGWGLYGAALSAGGAVYFGVLWWTRIPEVALLRERLCRLAGRRPAP